MSSLPITSVDSQFLLRHTASAPRETVAERGFGSVLLEQLGKINEQQLEADSAVAALTTGETDDVNHVVMQMAEADLTFRMAIEIRNRLLESYQEIMRMQV